MDYDKRYRRLLQNAAVWIDGSGTRFVFEQEGKSWEYEIRDGRLFCRKPSPKESIEDEITLVCIERDDHAGGVGSPV